MLQNSLQVLCTKVKIDVREKVSILDEIWTSEKAGRLTSPAAASLGKSRAKPERV